MRREEVKVKVERGRKGEKLGKKGMEEKKRMEKRKDGGKTKAKRGRRDGGKE